MKERIHTAIRITLCTLATILLALAHVAHIGVAAPPYTSVDLPFDLAAQAGKKETLDFKVTTPGCIMAQIKPWTSASQNGPRADRLQLTLNGADRAIAYAFITGSSSAAIPLWISYAASPSVVNRVRSWTFTVSTVNNRGTARGVVRIEYPPTQMPCALNVVVGSNGISGINGTNGISRTNSANTASIAGSTNSPNGVNISWLYTGPPFAGMFLIERSSNNGAAWRTVNGCSVTVSRRTSYACTDTGLASGDYLYRACAVTAGSGPLCSASNITPPVRVKIR